jgi:hypothetical protein
MGGKISAFGGFFVPPSQSLETNHSINSWQFPSQKQTSQENCLNISIFTVVQSIVLPVIQIDS